MLEELQPISLDALPREGERSIWLGKILNREEKAFFDVDKLVRHLAIAGGPGTGKTFAAMIIAEECLLKGIPVVVFEPYVRWTGFAQPCEEMDMLELYPKFGMKPDEARGFDITILEIIDPHLEVDVEEYVAEGKMTLFVLDKLTPKAYNTFMENTIQSLFYNREEYRELKLLMIFEDAYRLLPAFGGKGALMLERACREYRKWGIGIVVVSHSLSEFDQAVTANTETDIFFATNFENDLSFVKERYGLKYSQTLPKLAVGRCFIQNKDYNYSKPWGINIRPPLHSPKGLSDSEIKRLRVEYF
jgi:DNA helicase HerA-like ATPase